MEHIKLSDTSQRVTWDLQGQLGTSKMELIRLGRWTLAVDPQRLRINVLPICAFYEMGPRDFATQFRSDFRQPMFWRPFEKNNNWRIHPIVYRSIVEGEGSQKVADGTLQDPQPHIYGLWMCIPDALPVMRRMGLWGPELVEKLLHDKDKSLRNVFPDIMETFQDHNGC